MNWKHSNFQIFYHILGNCHTVVEGIRVMRELKQDRLFAIKSSLAEAKRSESKVLAANAVLSDKNETLAQKLTSLCNVEEQDARMEIAQPCYEASLHELAFIEYLLEKLEALIPHPVTQIHFQKIQALENAYDICMRTHTCISLQGSPSGELINESRNSPYQKQLMSAIYSLMGSFGDFSASREGRLGFLSLSKEEILGNLEVVGEEEYMKTLSLSEIEKPALEKLECKAFPLLLIEKTS